VLVSVSTIEVKVPREGAARGRPGEVPSPPAIIAVLSAAGVLRVLIFRKHEIYWLLRK
jgi:hypothetical protein